MGLIKSVVQPVAQSVLQRIDGVTGVGLARRFSGCVGAYSLQDIGGTGPVIDVREGSTTTSYTAAQVANGEHVSGATGSRFVSKWYDQSGDGNHLVQNTTSFQPKVTYNNGSAVTDSKGNYAIFFNPEETANTNTGTQSHFLQTNDSYFIKSIFHVSTQLKVQAFNINFSPIIGQEGQNKSYIFYPGAALNYAISMDGDGTVQDSGTWYKNGASGLNGGNVGSASDIVHNTTALYNIIYDSGDPGAVLNTIGKFGGAPGTLAYYWRGTMTEVLIYNEYKNDDRVAIRDDINSRYDIF